MNNKLLLNIFFYFLLLNAKYIFFFFLIQFYIFCIDSKESKNVNTSV